MWVPDNEVLREGRQDQLAGTSRGSTCRTSSATPSPRSASTRSSTKGPETLAFVRDHTAAKFAWVPDYSDYYPEAPGGLAHGRSVEPVPLDGRHLGPELARLHPAYTKAPVGLVVTAGRLPLAQPRHAHAARAAHRRQVAARPGVARAAAPADVRHGQALMIGLRTGLLDAGHPGLARDPADRARARGRPRRRRAGAKAGAEQEIRARRGVLLASGGFEHNVEMREKYQRAPITVDWTVGAPSNTGDGIQAAIAGSARRVDLMDDAWWGPSIPLPGRAVLLPGRAQPARRPSSSTRRAFASSTRRRRTSTPCTPCTTARPPPASRTSRRGWCSTSATATATCSPGSAPRQPFPGRWYKHGTIVKADTIDELAEAGRRDPAGAVGDDHAVQRLRRDRRRRRLPPRRQRLRPVLRRPPQQAEPLPRRHRPAAVLRGQDRARRPGHQGRLSSPTSTPARCATTAR